MSNDKDKICTYSISFRIRKNKLNMTVNMRSNDFILGTQIDFFQFSVIQEMLLKYLSLFWNRKSIPIYLLQILIASMLKNFWIGQK